MERIWLSQYPDGVPYEIDPDRYSSLIDMFEQSVMQFPDCVAYEHHHVELTYAELDHLTRQGAAYLQQQLSLQAGDRFGIILPNLIQYPIILFSALRAGLTVININPLYTSYELAFQLNDAAVKAVIVFENFAHTLEQALPLTVVQHIILTRYGDVLGAKGFFINVIIKYIKRLVPAHSLTFTAFKQLFNHDFQYNKPSINHGDIAFLQYTGGTTGQPKGVMLTHRNIIANAEQISAWMSPWMEVGKEVIFTVLPIYHIFCLEVNIISFFSIGARNVLITNPRDINHVIKVMKRTPITVITAVNTLFNALLNHPQFAAIDFSPLKVAMGGGMAVQQVVAERWQKITGKTLHEGYGLTEASPVVAANPLSNTQYTGSIGVPLPSTDIAVLDENNHELPQGEEGELCVKGPQVMKGFWKNTQTVIDDKGWLHTGDIVAVDSQGYIRIKERKKDMILVSGFNVYPNEVEGVIAKHDGVLEVAVVGVKNSHSGEAVKAFVVKRDPTLTGEALISYCKVYLTAYKIPKFVEFRDDLPKSAVGKILRRELRDETHDTTNN